MQDLCEMCSWSEVTAFLPSLLLVTPSQGYFRPSALAFLLSVAESEELPLCCLQEVVPRTQRQHCAARPALPSNRLREGSGGGGGRRRGDLAVATERHRCAAGCSLRSTKREGGAAWRGRPPTLLHGLNMCCSETEQSTQITAAAEFNER